MHEKKQSKTKKKTFWISGGRRRADPGSSVKSEKRREEILAAALKKFSEKGYDRTSVKDIGEEAGMLAGSLYYHIRSKDDLLYEILSDLHRFALTVTTTIESVGGQAIEKLRLVVRYHVKNLDLPRMRLFDAEFRHLSVERHKKIVDMRQEYFRYCVRLIEDAKNEGDCDKDVNARATALAMLGLLNSMPHWFNPAGSITAEQLAETCDRLLIRSLRSS